MISFRKTNTDYQINRYVDQLQLFQNRLKYQERKSSYRSAPIHLNFSESLTRLWNLSDQL